MPPRATVRWRRWCASRPRWRSARSITIWPARGGGNPRDRTRRCGRRWKPCCVSCAACMRSAGWMSTCRPFRRTWRFAAMNRTCRRWPAICWTTLANGRPAPVRHRRARRGMLLIHIDDDGRAFPRTSASAFERGTRLDEQRPGSGWDWISRAISRAAMAATCSPGVAAGRAARDAAPARRPRQRISVTGAWPAAAPGWRPSRPGCRPARIASAAHDDALAAVFARIGVDRHGRIAEFHMTGVVDAGVVEQPGLVGGPGLRADRTRRSCPA